MGMLHQQLLMNGRKRRRNESTPAARHVRSRGNIYPPAAVQQSAVARYQRMQLSRAVQSMSSAHARMFAQQAAALSVSAPQGRTGTAVAPRRVGASEAARGPASVVHLPQPTRRPALTARTPAVGPSVVSAAPSGLPRRRSPSQQPNTRSTAPARSARDQSANSRSAAHKLVDGLVLLDTSKARAVVLLHAALSWLVNDAGSICALERTCTLYRKLIQLADEQIWRHTFFCLFSDCLPVCCEWGGSWKGAVAARVRMFRNIPPPPPRVADRLRGPPPLHILVHNRAIHRIAYVGNAILLYLLVPCSSRYSPCLPCCDAPACTSR